MKMQAPHDTQQSFNVAEIKTKAKLNLKSKSKLFNHN